MPMRRSSSVVVVALFLWAIFLAIPWSSFAAGEAPVAVAGPPAAVGAPTAGGDSPAAAPLKSLDETVAALPHEDVRGHVLDNLGQALGQADIFLYYSPDRSGVRDRVAGKAQTAADGSFRFEKALVWEPVTVSDRNSGKPKYAVLARHPEQGLNFTVLLQGDDLTSVGVRLPGKAANVPDRPTQVIQDADGKPIAGVRAFLAFADHFGGDPEKEARERRSISLLQDIGLCSLVTDEEGRFAPIKMADGGNTGYILAKDGYAKGYVYNGNPFGLMFPGATVSGRVTWPDGKPASGVAVLMNYSGESLVWNDATVTDQEGRYAFKNAPGSGYSYSMMSAASREREKKGKGTAGVKAVDPRPGSALVSVKQSFPINPGDALTKDLAFTDACVLSGTVVDLTTGKPAAGVNLDRYIEVPGTRSLDSATVVSDENGKFSTTVAPGSNVSFQWERSREGKYIIDQEWQQGGDGGGGNYQPFRQQVVSKSQSDLVFKVKLWPVAPLKGQVTDAQGKPVDGASVCMHSEVEPVKTDKDGRFTLAVAPTDRDYDLLAMSAKKDLAAIVHVTKGAAATTIALEPTRDYQGEVKTEDGLPAPKLKFYMDVKINKSSIYRAREEPTTDAAGAFTAKNLCPKAAYAIFWSGDNEDNRAYDHGNAEADLTKIAEGEPIRFKAKMYVNALMGRVVDEKKEPVVGAKVEPQPSELMRQDDRQNPKPVMTGKDGSFTVERLAAGEISLRVSATGYKTKSFKAHTDDVDFTAALPAPKTGVGLTFAITVKDEQGQPVAGAPLELRTRVYGSAKSTTASVTQKTDATGKAQFAFAGLKEKQGGQGYIVCDRPGYNLGFLSAGRLDEDMDAVLALEKEGKTWHGRVVDAEHKPIAHAKVLVGVISLGETNEGYVSMQEADAPACASDADGRFELKRVSPNIGVSMWVGAEGYSRENKFLDPKQDGDKEKEFVLQPAGTILGKIVAEGGGAPTGKWGVYATLPTGGFRGIDEAKVESDGTFRIQGVREGTYTVTASAASTETLRWVCSQAPSVDVVAGQTSKVEIQTRPGIELKCKIVRPQGATTEAEKVRTVFAKPSEDRDGSGLGTRAGLPDSEGNWRLYLPEGTFELNYSLEGKPPTPTGQKIVVTKGKPLDEIVIEVK